MEKNYISFHGGIFTKTQLIWQLSSIRTTLELRIHISRILSIFCLPIQIIYSALQLRVRFHIDSIFNIISMPLIY